MAFTADKVRQGVQKDTGYSIDNSLRFNYDDRAYLSRTPGSAGNRKTWTWSGWVKQSTVDNSKSNNNVLFCTPNSSRFEITIDHDAVGGGGASDGTQRLSVDINSESVLWISDNMHRDPSGWYHIVVALDTTQSSYTDRLKMYVNGTKITSFYTQNGSGTLTLNSQFAVNNTITHNVGRRNSSYGSNYYLDGYLSEVHFIDGQALDPTSFGETGTYGEWKPIAVTGMTYGTNGFYLDFKVAGTGTTGAGKDVSGEGNHWSTSGIASTDQMLDSPTNNFCTMNPNSPNTQVLSQGNLHSTGNTGRSAVATQGMTTGKWYWEFYWTGGNNEVRIGATDDVSNGGYGGGIHAYSWTGNIANYLSGGNTNISCSPSMSENSIIGWAWDADIGELKAFVNGTAVNSGAAIVTGFTGYTLHPHGGQGASGYNIFYNFGQDSTFHNTKGSSGSYADSNGIGDFYYEPPTDFLALCTSNLPDPAVIPSEHFNTVLYTGNNSTNAITGVGFQPDFFWGKARSGPQSHRLVDVLRGSYNLYSDLTNAEDLQTLSFTSDGFTWASGGANDNGKTYVAWNWKANGTGVSNTNGSITSTVSANVDAGFSIVSYTGTGANATVGHGLAKKPNIFMLKGRNDTPRNWRVYSDTIGATKHLYLNTTASEQVSSTQFNNTEPTSSVFTIGSHGGVNTSTKDYIAYCFHSVDGYSKVGSYTGNMSADGPFVYTGFRPKYIMVKDSSTATGWYIYDTVRDINIHNPAYKTLVPNTSGAESGSATSHWDILSNGFKPRYANNEWNANGSTMIYIAFAEVPFKFSNAR